MINEKQLDLPLRDEPIDFAKKKGEILERDQKIEEGVEKFFQKEKPKGGDRFNDAYIYRIIIDLPDDGYIDEIPISGKRYHTLSDKIKAKLENMGLKYYADEEKGYISSENKSPQKKLEKTGFRVEKSGKIREKWGAGAGMPEGDLDEK